MSISAISNPMAHTQLGDAGRSKSSGHKGSTEFATLSGIKETSGIEDDTSHKKTAKTQENKTDSQHDKVADDRIKRAEVKFKLDGTREQIKHLDNGTKMHTPIDDMKNSFKIALPNKDIPKDNIENSSLTATLFNEIA